MMLSLIITRYLAAHKRLVVPQLGAFIVKVPGREVVFSEMLKRDDGVLRGLLAEEGMGEIEASGTIDRFVFELRHTVESGSVYQAEGLGVFASGPNGTIRFRFLPTLGMPAPEPAAPAAESPAAPEPAAPAAEASPAAAPAEPVPAEPVAPVASEPVVPVEPVAPESGRDAEAAAAADEPEAGAGEPRRRVRDLFRDEPEAASGKAHARRTDPSVRGLRYGKPMKTTDAYTYVNSSSGTRRFDIFIILAIAVVLVALGAILYGWMVQREADEERAAVERTEQGVDPATLTDDDLQITGEGR